MTTSTADATSRPVVLWPWVCHSGEKRIWLVVTSNAASASAMTRTRAVTRSNAAFDDASTSLTSTVHSTRSGSRSADASPMMVIEPTANAPALR